MSEENKKIVRRWFEEVWNRGSESAIEEMLDAEGVAHGLGDSEQDVKGPAEFKPYAVGYVELPGEVKVESRLTECDPAVLVNGMEMELVIVPFRTDDDGNEVVTFAFRPVA